MAGMTLAEAQAQLVTVNQAIANLVAGKRMNHLEIGSGAFRRVYKYEDITLTELTNYRNELLGIIEELEATTPTFKGNMTIPLTVRKDIY